MAGKKKAGKSAKDTGGGKGRRFSPMEEEFCRQFLLCGGNGAEAFRLAGYKGASHRQRAYVLLQSPKIQARIKELREKSAEVVGITPEMVAAQLKRLAFSDMRKAGAWGPNGFSPFFSHPGIHQAKTPDGQEVEAVHEGIDDDTAAAIQEVSIKPGMFGAAIKIKMADRLDALKEINAMFGFRASDRLAERQAPAKSTEDPLNGDGSPGSADDPGTMDATELRRRIEEKIRRSRGG